MPKFNTISNKVLLENVFDRIEKEAQQAAIDEAKAEAEARSRLRSSEYIVERKVAHSVNTNRLNSFIESVNHALLGECVYHVYRKAIRESLAEQPNITAMMRAMVGDFIKEDYASIISKMRNGSNVLSEMYNLITSTKKKILEAAEFDKTDPSTYRIGKDVKDDFFSKLETMDDDSITTAIRARVSDAVSDFETANKKDHDDIVDIIAQTNDKIEALGPKPNEAVKESYERISKGKIAKVRNRKKTVFESMVTAMCESTLKDDQLKEEFMEGTRLNIPKIVDRIETMYTFIETVNTMRLYPIDKAYVESLINSLKG